MSRLIFLLTCLIVLMLAVRSGAEPVLVEDNATTFIYGFVKDPSGGVEGVTVRILVKSCSGSPDEIYADLETNEDGFYIIPNVPKNYYEIRVVGDRQTIPTEVLMYMKKEVCK